MLPGLSSESRRIDGTATPRLLSCAGELSLATHERELKDDETSRELYGIHSQNGIDPGSRFIEGNI